MAEERPLEGAQCGGQPADFLAVFSEPLPVSINRLSAHISVLTLLVSVHLQH